MATFYRDRIYADVVWIGDRTTDIGIMVGEGAPTDGTEGTGAGLLGPGSVYINSTTGAWTKNTGTKADPTWVDMVGD